VNSGSGLYRESTETRESTGTDGADGAEGLGLQPQLTISLFAILILLARKQPPSETNSSKKPKAQIMRIKAFG
jgi:hypothetical protein